MKNNILKQALVRLKKKYGVSKQEEPRPTAVQVRYMGPNGQIHRACVYGSDK